MNYEENYVVQEWCVYNKVNDINNLDCYIKDDSVSYIMVEDKIKNAETKIFKYIEKYENECNTVTGYSYSDLYW